MWLRGLQAVHSYSGSVSATLKNRRGGEETSGGERRDVRVRMGKRVQERKKDSKRRSI